jgi:hypothetical protein
LNSAPGSQISSSTTGWPRGQQQAADLHRRLAALQSSARATSAGRAHAPAVEQAALQAAVAAVVGHQAQEAVLRAFLGVRGDEGALALPAHEQVLCASSSMALRTVPWLTLKRAASSNSLGIASPGRHSPACRSRSSSALICWYSGLKDGGPRHGRGGRRGRSGALQHRRGHGVDADVLHKT